MTSKVKVTADKHGNVIGITKNPEYGWVRVTQNLMEINAEGWLRKTTRSAFIKGKVTDLVELGYKENDELPGKIIVTESLTPFNTNDPDRDLKMAGETGVVCRVYDEPIYRQTFYKTDTEAKDTFIAHTNTQEIRDAQAAEKTMDALGGAFKNKEAVQL